MYLAGLTEQASIFNGQGRLVAKSADKIQVAGSKNGLARVVDSYYTR